MSLYVYNITQVGCYGSQISFDWYATPVSHFLDCAHIWLLFCPRSCFVCQQHYAFHKCFEIIYRAYLFMYIYLCMCFDIMIISTRFERGGTSGDMTWIFLTVMTLCLKHIGSRRSNSKEMTMRAAILMLPEKRGSRKCVGPVWWNTSVLRCRMCMAFVMYIANQF